MLILRPRGLKGRCQRETREQGALTPPGGRDRSRLVVLVGTNPMASNGSLWTVPDFPNRVR